MRARLNYTDFEDKPVTVELSSDLPVTIGRSRDNTVMLRDEHASRMHARIHCDNGAWRVRDFGLNGTKVNGEKIDQEAVIRHGDEVCIGDTRIRFTILDVSPGGASTKRIMIAAEPSPTAQLTYEDLAVVSAFMVNSIRQTDLTTLLHNALEVILHQTSANLVAFLSDDSHDPQTKMSVPETARVDIGLAKQLNRRLQRDGETVWLCCDVAETRTPEKFAQFSDALCLPVRSATGRSHGAIHVYRMNAYFTDRDLNLCEAIVGFLAECIQQCRRQLRLEAESLRNRNRLSGTEELVGDSDAMRDLRQSVARLAPKSSAVLLSGEYGTGKELVAHALHQLSSRAHGPFVVVNCSVVDGSMFEAELFGYRKGAFAGADRDHLGHIQLADEGTLFFDEVADLSLAAQDKLLRFIESRSIRPLGSSTDIHVNVRVIAATHRDLAHEVEHGRLRADLLRHLQENAIIVPPLRDHANDIHMLAQYFLDKLGAELRKQFRLTESAIAKLRSYSWPGNIRQLRAVFEWATVSATSETLDASAFPLEQPDQSALSLNLVEHERWAVAEALKRANGNKTKAAAILGMNRETLYAKIEKYGLERKVADAIA